MVEPSPISVLNVLFIALGCALALAAANWLTRDRITDNKQNALLREAQTLTDQLPAGFGHDITTPGRWALCDGTLLVSARAAGYGGPMDLLYTLEYRANGSYGTGRLRVARHQETPGITDFLRQPQRGWLASLNHQSSSGLTRIDSLSGATITSRALLDHLIDSLAASAAVSELPGPASCP